MSEVYKLLSFKQLIQEGTGVSATASSLVDHIATTCPNDIVDSGVLQVSMNNHCLVYCLRKLNGAQRQDHKVIKTKTLIKLLFSLMCLKLIGIE